jgi:hypothetical protein
MAVLLEILIESLVLIGFLWVGKSVMKAQVHFKTLLVTGLAGAFASQVPFVGIYLSISVVLFFLWKMTRVDIVPDVVLIVIMGKGAGILVMIFAAAIFMDSVDPEELTSLNEIPVYIDDDGIRYFADGDKVFYRDENEEQVFVDANALFGITEVMDVADKSVPTEESIDEGSSQLALDDTAETSEGEVEDSVVDHLDEFTAPSFSDTVVRGEPVPYKIFVPRGWKTQRKNDALSIRFEDHTYFNCYSRGSGSDNKSYLREEVNRVLSQYPGYTLARQDIVTLDRKKWAKIQFANNNGDQVLLMTHASKFGSYTVELNGSFQQLTSKKAMLNRMMSSFNFPPSTYYLAQLETAE